MTSPSSDFLDTPTALPKDLREARMGLALSGGGYRAAGFHLGTMAYLERVKLLPQLRRLSTVSGGSFTGAKYILFLTDPDTIKHKRTFKDFFLGFYKFLKSAKLIDEGLDDYAHGKVQVPSGERKLISSMANVYAKDFLKSSDGTPYRFGQILDAKHLKVEEIIFNATEFRNGIAFRFQKSLSSRADIGNGLVSIPKESAKKIRMADIVAASSCFPGGFEPMAFPIDFNWPGNQVPPEVTEAIEKDKPVKQILPENLEVAKKTSLGDSVIALMDGGIYDNRGIESLLLADDHKDAKKLDFFIMSDVDPHQDNLYPYPAPTAPPAINLTLGQVDWLVRIFLGLCVLTVGAIGYELGSQIAKGTFVFWPDFYAYVVPIVLVAFALISLGYIRYLIGYELLKEVPQAGRTAWNDLKRLTVHEFWYTMRLRATSVFALTGSVFMDRIRKLISKAVYRDQQLKKKSISNRIDRLLKKPFKSSEGVEPPSEALKHRVKEAAQMPTTLWFKSGAAKEELDSLVIAGQATVCFNLLQYIYRQYKKPGKDGSVVNMADYPKIEALWDELLVDWKMLNTDPRSLL